MYMSEWSTSVTHGFANCTFVSKVLTSQSEA